MDLKFHNQVAELCLKQYENLPKTGKPKNAEWTVLSCILQEDESGLSVVALGTGTKCIGNDKLSDNGKILNDSHAEVVCRRAFLRYIYENMMCKNSLLVSFNTDKQSFSLKKEVSFHFFTTHVPCGDAAIFEKQDIDNFGNIISETLLNSVKDDSLKRSCELSAEIKSKKIKLDSEEKDIFRTGAKCLQQDERQDLKLDGTGYHITGVVRTKPGRGTPTLSVSCSDKLAKWCHLGLQGALLSILLHEPIYFNSFTVVGGTPFNEEALKHALFTRLGNVVLTAPYYVRKPIIGQASIEFLHSKLENKQPSATSIIWWKSADSKISNLEVAVNGKKQGVTKKQMEKSGALKICKMELFKRFIQILNEYKILLNDMDNTNLSYSKAKMFARTYQKCWLMLKKEFRHWSNKQPLNFQYP